MGLGPARAYTRSSDMCGIAGLFSKSLDLSGGLGGHLGAMLLQLSDRGPDSAGVAIYRDPAPSGSSKVSLFSADPEQDWGAVRDALAAEFGAGEPEVRASHAVIVVETEAEAAQDWLREYLPELRVMSAGQTIEIYKEAGSPRDFVRAFALDEMQGSHALGHTRMATESAVTTEHSHPFSTGLDLCLVHNGSLSNHNDLRRRLRKEGIRFQTDNDTEVAAGYLTYRLAEGASLEQALEGCLEDLDGFYTFAVGTADGFAVLRDPIACKPAVMAETDDWVAMASEYRAIAVLPGAETATTWEPEPGRVYSWERAPV
jgi:methylamine---glutamate N-methyltransferase subunit A